MTAAELKNCAAELGLKNYQQLNKADLLKLVKDALENGHDDQEKQDQSEKSVEVSEKKSHAQDLQQNDDLKNHPKFSKFYKGEN